MLFRSGKPYRVWVSAKTGAGIETLLEAVSELLAGEMSDQLLRVAPSEAKLRSKLYAANYVENEEITDDGHYLLRVRMPLQEFDRIKLLGGVVIEGVRRGAE